MREDKPFRLSTHTLNYTCPSTTRRYINRQCTDDGMLHSTDNGLPGSLAAAAAAASAAGRFLRGHIYWLYGRRSKRNGHGGWGQGALEGGCDEGRRIG